MDDKLLKEFMEFQKAKETATNVAPLREYTAPKKTSKKLADLSWFQSKKLIVGLNSELSELSKDPNFLELVNDFKNLATGEKPQLLIVNELINFLLIEHEENLDNILALLMQTSVSELQNMQNVDIVEQVISFFSIETYKSAFLKALKLA